MKFNGYSLGDVPVLHYDALPSTNTLAKELFLRGEQTFCVVRADTQSAGRGRLGRSFFSQSGVFMSLLLTPSRFSVPAELLTSAAASAVCRVVREAGYDASIKWVNDIFVSGKKVCGILTEAITAERVGYIIGIGINIGEADFPEELCDIAGTLAHSEKDALFARLVPALLDALNVPPEAILRDCAAYSCVIGKRVRFFGAAEGEGVAKGLAPDGGLLVRTDDGALRHLISGEISLRTI